ncbi:hypothetical protein F511_33458 [Dorcoceras hygrometricum]|uniref:Mucin-2-like n=1 Tax=Dorcoceras hygrometricum TaxID=472368 RepID=A0A2Z7CL53_9LAMI|nr:hypothetical protein F511_33458 [Dorcoceras hygrometricum]
MCSGGTVDNQLREAFCVESIPVPNIPVAMYTSRGKHSSLTFDDNGIIPNQQEPSHRFVFDMDDAGLAQVFETLIATGLRNFLGCPTVFYEAALIEFFTNGSVREDGMVAFFTHFSIRLASSLISNSHHIDFDSVFDMDDAALAQVFETLIAMGLRNFLGCPSVFYEEALLEFFANGTVRDGLVVSTVHGVTVDISEQLFAETFELPVEGLTDLTDVPKDKIFDARSLFSASKDQM